MEKFEFIQQAALAILRSGNYRTIQEVACCASFVADDLWIKQEALNKAKEVSSFDKTPLSEVYDELDRMDKNEHKGHSQKSGYKAKMIRVCDVAGLKSVADVLAMGSAKFGSLRQVGWKLEYNVNEALKNLYDIKSW